MEKEIKYNKIPFDINRINEEGIEIVTRDDRKVRIICTDALGNLPIVGLITLSDSEGEFEIPLRYCITGKRYPPLEDDNDLFLKVPIRHRMMTNQELAWWLRDCPEEHREWKSDDFNCAQYSYAYFESEANIDCPNSALIRSNGGEWKKPLIEFE